MTTVIVVTDVDSPNPPKLWEDLAPLVDVTNIGAFYEGGARTLTLHVEDMRGATEPAVRAIAKTHNPLGLTVAQQATKDLLTRVAAAKATFPATQAGKDALLKDLLDLEAGRQGIP